MIESRRLLPLLLIGLLAGCGDDGSSDYDAGPPPEDQCLASGDMDIILGRRIPDGGWPDGGAQETVLEFFEICVRGPCFEFVFDDAPSELTACTNECIDPTDIGNLSVGCRQCYQNEVTCVVDHCVAACLNGSGAACEECFLTFCNDDSIVCRGFE